MIAVPTIRATLLAAAIAIGLAGCSDNKEEMSQEEIQYLSHLDQSRFFQRQGELKASTQEARSAIELQPGRADPYFVILNNLLTAGDAVTTERQLDYLLENLPDSAQSRELLNQARLIRAEADLMQGETQDALKALDELDSPERSHQHQALLLKGRILVAADRPDEAETAFEEAKKHSESSVAPIIGLSKISWERGNTEIARARIAEAEAIDPESSELWLWKAQVAEATKQWRESEEAYVQALEGIGRYDIMTYRKYETISSLIRVLREQGKASEAFVYEEILAQSAPGTIKSNLSAAQQAFEKGDYNAAVSYLEETLAQAPASEQARLMLGMIRFRQGNFEEAEALLGPIANLGESDVASKLMAASRLQLRDPEGAQAILERLDTKDSDPSVIAMAGIASLATGARETGEALLRKSISLQPENPQLRLRFARYLLEENRPQEALEELEAVLKNTPESTPARSLTIQAHLAAGNTEAAVSAADQWVHEQPTDLVTLMTRGNLAANLGNYAGAMEYFNEAAKNHPESEKPYIAMGRASLASENREQARVHFETAANMQPNSLEALQGLAMVYQTDELLALVRELSGNHPEASAPKLILLEFALREGDQSRASDLTATLLERNEESRPAPAAEFVAMIYSRVASRQREAGELNKAADTLESGRVLFPENEDIALQAAVINFDQDKDSRGREILTEIKAFAPRSPRPYLLEAGYLKEQGESGQAAELYQLAIEKGAGAQAKLDLIQVLQNSGRTDTAIEVVEQALEAHPDNQAIALASAMLYQQDEQSEKARSTYEKVLELDPDNALALNNLAWIYFEQDDPRALALAERAYEQGTENAAIADTYGWILFKSGDNENSVPVLAQAHTLAPDSQEIALHLAEAYRAIGENAKAKEMLTKFDEQE